MPQLSLTQETFKSFVSDNLNDTNFLLFQSLLSISNRTQLLTIMTALLNKVINIEDLASLSGFDDAEVASFIQNRIKTVELEFSNLSSPAGLAVLTDLTANYGFGELLIESKANEESNFRPFLVNLKHTILAKYNPTLTELSEECANTVSSSLGYTWNSLFDSSSMNNGITNWVDTIFKVFKDQTVQDSLLTIDNTISIALRYTSISRFMLSYKSPMYYKPLLWSLASELNGTLISKDFVVAKIQTLVNRTYNADSLILNTEYFVNELKFWSSLALKLNAESESITKLNNTLAFIENLQVKQEKWINSFFIEARKSFIGSFPSSYSDENSL